jgi:hypothetical protein
VKILTLVALTSLIVLTADAGRHLSSCCGEADRPVAESVAVTPATTPPFRDLSDRTSRRVDANGNRALVTVQTAFGFNITVHPAYASKFLKFFALLKDRGYHVPANITRCWAPHGTHVPGSNHYIGAACDIQTGWNRGPKFVYHISDIIKEAGLYDGCSFRDCGHIEAVRGTHNRPPKVYASIEHLKNEQAASNNRQ